MLFELGRVDALDAGEFIEVAALRVEVPARTVDEPRGFVIGQISGKHGSAVVAYRGERVHLTSVGRSRTEEVEINEG